MLREAACLQLPLRLFQILVPLNEKDFLPFSVLFCGNLRSVDVLRKESMLFTRLSADITPMTNPWKINGKHFTI